MGRLFWKLFLAFWVTLVISAIGAGSVVWLQRQSREAAERDLAAGPLPALTMSQAAATLRHGGRDALRAWMQDLERTRPVPLFAVDAEGVDLLGRPVPPGALASARELVRASPDARAARRVVAAGGGDYLLFVPLSPDVRRAPPPARRWLWMLIAIGAVTGMAVSALLAWHLTRPIRSLRWAFDAVAEGRLDTRVQPLIGSRRDEIADLGREFDRMTSQLQALVAAQRRLLHDVSHELRSPLARLHAAIGLARQRPEESERSFERIEREAARLDALVGEVLTLARLEAGTGPAERIPVDIVDLVAAVAGNARFEAEATGRRVRLDAGENTFTVSGQAELLHRAIENVVRNAVKYTDPDSVVDIEVQRLDAPPRVRVRVRDHGPGVQAHELDRIFEPFYRGANGAGRAGVGLGLAIARRAIEAHDGSIRAENADGGGLRVQIELPVAASP